MINTFNRLPKNILIIYLLFIVVAVGGVTFNHMDTREQRLLKNAENANKTIDAAFDNAESLLKFIASSIVDNYSPAFIEKVLSGLQPENGTKQLAAWNYVSWVTLARTISITSRTGILKHPKMIDRNRPTVTSALATPGKLFIGKPDSGVITGQWILPTTLGVANKNGKIIGALHMTLMVSSVESRIQDSIDKDLKFAIIDKITGRAILGSDDVKGVNFTKRTAIGGAVYHIIKESDRYPFAIAIGYVSSLDNKTLMGKLINVVLTLVLIAIIGLFSLSIFWRKAIRPIRKLTESTDIAATKKEISRSNSFPEVTLLADHLSTLVTACSEAKTAKDEAEKAYKLAKAEGEIAQNSIAAITDMFAKYKQSGLLSFSTLEDEVTAINVKEMLESCINIYAYQAFTQNIKMDLSIDIARYFYNDALKLKQIFIGLLSYSMLGELDNDAIKVTAKEVQLYGGNFLAVTILDNGIIDNSLGVGEVIIEGVLERNNSRITESGLINALKLIKQLDGRFHVDSILGKGTEYTVFIPEKPAVIGANSNVISFVDQRKLR